MPGRICSPHPDPSLPATEKVLAGLLGPWTELGFRVYAPRQEKDRSSPDAPSSLRPWAVGGSRASWGYKVSPLTPFQPVTMPNLSIIAHFSLWSPRASQPQTAHCPLPGYFPQGETPFLITSKTIINTEHHRMGCDNKYNDGALLRKVEWSEQGRPQPGHLDLDLSSLLTCSVTPDKSLNLSVPPFPRK